MAKIDRLNGNVEPFGVNATGSNRTVFGSDSQTPTISDTLDDNINVEYKLGWEFVGVSGLPPLEYFNGSMYANSALTTYLYQMGVAEWNNSQEYFTNSIANEGGILYKAIQDNIGNQPSLDGGVNWVNAVDIPDATTTIKGKVEKATQTEMNNGTADKYPDATAVKTYVDNQVATGLVQDGNNTIAFNNTVVVNTWTDLDLTSIVGTNKAKLEILVVMDQTSDVVFRIKGETRQPSDNLTLGRGVSNARVDQNEYEVFVIHTDATGFAQYNISDTTGTPNMQIEVLTYVVL